MLKIELADELHCDDCPCRRDGDCGVTGRELFYYRVDEGGEPLDEGARPHGPAWLRYGRPDECINASGVRV